MDGVPEKAGDAAEELGDAAEDHVSEVDEEMNTVGDLPSTPAVPAEPRRRPSAVQVRGRMTARRHTHAGAAGSSRLSRSA